MSGRRTGAPIVARCETQLMWPVTYDEAGLGQARDPLEWFPIGMPNLGLGAMGLYGGGVDITYLLQLISGTQ